MKKREWILAFPFIVSGMTLLAPYAVAEPLGYAAPLDWAGSGARVNILNSDDTVSSPVIDLSYTAGATTTMNYASGMGSAQSESSAYVLKGSVSSGEPEAWQAGGYFRDQLFFSTYNSQPAQLALTFSVSASGYVPTTGTWNDEDEWVPDVLQTGYAQLNLGFNIPIVPSGWTSPNPVPNWYYTANQMLVDANSSNGPDSENPGAFSLDSTVTLTTDCTFRTDTGPCDSNDYLVGSGTYLPFSVGLWGTVKNASLFWDNTVELIGVQAFQDGVALDNSMFTILSSNNEQYFSEFAHEMPVPEPGTLALLGLGLAGLGFSHRKQQLVPI